MFASFNAVLSKGTVCGTYQVFSKYLMSERMLNKADNQQFSAN